MSQSLDCRQAAKLTGDRHQKSKPISTLKTVTTATPYSSNIAPYTNPHKKMRVDAWVKTVVAITYKAFQRASNYTIWYYTHFARMS